MPISGTGDVPDTQSHDAEMATEYGSVIFVESTHGGSCDGETFEVLNFGSNTTRATVLLAHRYGRVQINGDELIRRYAMNVFLS